MPWFQTGATQYHAQLGLPDKGRAIKGLDVCNNWDLEPLDLLNGLALGCYQPSPKVLILLYVLYMFSGSNYKILLVNKLYMIKQIKLCTANFTSK